MNTQSWQIPCPRCGWANSGALTKCAKCGQLLGARPGMLVAGQSLSAKPAMAKSTKVAKPGGFLPRLIALIIDAMILLAILIPINALWASQLAPLDVKPDSNIALETLQRRASLYLALVVLQLFYFAGSWTMLGATPGQLLMSLRVTDAKAGGVGFFRAAMRWFWFSILGPLSIITMLGKDKRALHDMLAGTYVIQVVNADEVGGESSGLPPAIAAAAAAPAPAPAPAPVAAPTPVATGADFGSARPAAPQPADTYVPAPSALDFPAAPMSAPEPAPMYSPEPLPGPPPAGPGGDDGLYAPPPMFEPDSTVDAPPAAPREVYTAQPGQLSERAMKSAELYSAPPELAAPAAAEPASGGTGASQPAAEQHQGEQPGPAPEPVGGELPPFEFPPMAAPPKEDHHQP